MLYLKGLIEFVQANPKLQLTGSYYFGCAVEASDVDFFIDEMETVNLAEHFKFVPITQEETDYTDAMTSAVFYSPELKCHYQCVRNFDAKLKAQKFLKEIPGINSTMRVLSKSQRTRLWNWALVQTGGWNPTREVEISDVIKPSKKARSVPK